jgi:hypothetical protein
MGRIARRLAAPVKGLFRRLLLRKSRRATDASAHLLQRMLRYASAEFSSVARLQGTRETALSGHLHSPLSCSLRASFARVPAREAEPQITEILISIVRSAEFEKDYSVQSLLRQVRRRRRAVKNRAL